MSVLVGRTLAELRAGDQADLFVLIEALTARSTKQGDPYYVLEVSDRSARAVVRVWADQKAFEPCRSASRGDIVKLRVAVEKTGTSIELKGIGLRGVEESDSLDSDRVVGPIRPEALPVARGVVAFDIETTPRLSARDLPERELRKFLRWAVEDARREAGAEPPGDGEVEESLRKALALNPLTTRIVSIAFHALDSGHDLALVDLGESAEEVTPPAIALGEREILETFWAVARRVRVLVGFNSRRFDVPVILTRSALLGVAAPTDLLGGRHDRDACHVDLQDVLAARGAASDRRLSLELASFAFGIPAKSSVHGSEVGLLVEEERFQELAEYNIEDARATAELYRKLRGTWL